MTPPASLRGTPGPLARSHDLALLDLDGVVYIGDEAVPGAADAVEEAAGTGLRVSYVTNNASRPPEAVAAHLRRLGLPAAAEDVVTSAQVAAALLARRLPPGGAVLVVGGAGLEQALTAVGLAPVRSMDDSPLAVVQGFSPDIGWRLLAEGARAVRAGLPWVATNTDLTVPTPHGPAPGNGTLVQAVAAAAGRPPDEVAGKPSPAAFLEAARRYGARAPLVVGDRLDTDLEGARAAGMPGLAVLTGIAGVSELVAATPPRRPDHIGLDLRSLQEIHPPVVPDGDGGAVCRDARVTVAGTALVVARAGEDPVDVLRAAVVAAWAAQDRDAARQAPDPGEVVAVVHRLSATAGVPAGWAR